METQETRDFAEFITDLRGGGCHYDLSKALQAAADAAMKTGKIATVSLTVKIKPQGERQVEIIDQIKKTIPEPTQPTTIMFVDDERNLTRDDRRQMELKDVEPKKAELVDIKKPEKELKEVGA